MTTETTTPATCTAVTARSASCKRPVVAGTDRCAFHAGLNDAPATPAEETTEAPVKATRPAPKAKAPAKATTAKAPAKKAAPKAATMAGIHIIDADGKILKSGLDDRKAARVSARRLSKDSTVFLVDGDKRTEYRNGGQV